MGPADPCGTHMQEPTYPQIEPILIDSLLPPLLLLHPASPRWPLLRPGAALPALAWRCSALLCQVVALPCLASLLPHTDDHRGPALSPRSVDRRPMNHGIFILCDVVQQGRVAQLRWTETAWQPGTCGEASEVDDKRPDEVQQATGGGARSNVCWEVAESM
jgi:hypothetical protein